MSDDLQARANTIAEAANECCGRSDGWQDVIQVVALEQLRAAVEAEREGCAALCDEDDYVDGHGFAKAIRARKP